LAHTPSASSFSTINYHSPLSFPVTTIFDSLSHYSKKLNSAWPAAADITLQIADKDSVIT
jgi:hypothetical protein